MLPNRQQKVLKTFILENQLTQHSQVIISPVNVSSKEIDLFQLVKQNIDNWESLNFKIYDFKTNQYKRFDQLGGGGCKGKQYHVPNQYVNNGQAVVLIKYKHANEHSVSSSKQQTFSESADDLREVISDTSSLKKQRAKQRAISEVIEIVKHWRQLHLQKRGDKKISLQQAAKLVGLPKKSLDDYYYQLRLGEKYNFDFKTHLYEGIGCLRNFLKDKRPRLKSQQSQKRPKNLKIIDEFDQMRVGFRNMAMDMEQQDGDYVQVEKRQRHDNKKVHYTSNYNNNNKKSYNNNTKQYGDKKNQKQQQKKQQQPIFFQQPYYNNTNNNIYYSGNNGNDKNIYCNNNNNNTNYNSNNQMKQIIGDEQQQQKYSKMFEQDSDSIEMKLQNQFYEDFGYMQSYQDPFINLDGNFKKKKYQNMFDQELFF